jgi:hypothetical protein
MYYYFITTETPPVGQNQYRNTSLITSTVIAVCIPSSVLIFITAMGGWVCHKRNAKGSDKTTNPQAAPVDEEVQPPVSMHARRELEIHGRKLSDL